MTEEEMAEEWIKEHSGLIGSYKFVKYDYDSLKQAFIAGLKTGKDINVPTKWHKVADGDYPPCEKGYYTVNVLTNYGDIACYDYNEGCWIAEPSSVEIDPPVAWCEIPKYAEE